MTTTTTHDALATLTATEAEGVTVDSLDLRHAVIGDGLILNQTHGRLILHAVDPGGRARRLGAFDSPAAALAHLDTLDG